METTSRFQQMTRPTQTAEERDGGTGRTKAETGGAGGASSQRGDMKKGGGGGGET